MYLYGSEHALMDYHFNTAKVEVKEETKEEVKDPEDGADTDRTE